MEAAYILIKQIHESFLTYTTSKHNKLCKFSPSIVLSGLVGIMLQNSFIILFRISLNYAQFYSFMLLQLSLLPMFFFFTVP